MPVTISSTITLPSSVTQGRTATVCEPTAVRLGSNLLYTGNWFAAVSDSLGNAWQALSPLDYFPPASGGFCCDQSTVVDASRGLTAWVLQYKHDDTENTLRVAVNTNGDLTGGRWDLYDLTPTMVDAGWTHQWFDYNHVTLSDNYLYVITNTFGFDDRFTQCVVFRLSLDGLAQGSLNDFDVFVAPSEYFSLRATEGAKDEIFFFAHKSTSAVTVFRWPEAGTTSNFTVDVTRWTRGNLYSPTPDGNNWLRRGDGRITGAWTSGTRIGALWMGNARGTIPHPFIRSICIDATTESLVAEPDMWSPHFALGYPSAGVNDDGDVAVSFFYGGERQFVHHAVGKLDLGALTWSLRRAVAGDRGPIEQKWGDYLSCRADPANAGGWVSSGYTMQGGGTRNNVTPHLVFFS